MRKAFFILLLAASSQAFCQSVIRTLAWELNTARPALQHWQLVRGETVDLECRYLAGAAAMDVRGAAVVLHCRTNGMAEGYSYQVTGRVGRAAATNLASVGWTTVRVRPDLDLPHNVKAVTFTLETMLGDARNLVASGTLGLSGNPTGAAPASTQLYQYDAKGSAQDVSNALAQALQAESDNRVSADEAEAEARRSAAAALTNLVLSLDLDAVARVGSSISDGSISLSADSGGLGWQLGYGGTSGYALDTALDSWNYAFDGMYVTRVSETYAPRGTWNTWAQHLTFGSTFINTDQPENSRIIAMDGTSAGKLISGHPDTPTVWWLDRGPGEFSPASASDIVPVVATNRWSSLVWRSAMTNAVYVQEWDATNGTFVVKEIIP